MNTIDDFKRLLVFLIRAIDLEALGGLRMPMGHMGKKFISPWRGAEPLFWAGAPEAAFSPDAQGDRAFLEAMTRASANQARAYYGYPIYRNAKGYISPLFFVEVGVQAQDDGYALHPIWPTLGVNREILHDAQYSREEADDLVRELEGEFGTFEARLNAAAEALDIPDGAFTADETVSLADASSNTNANWINAAVLFSANISQAKLALRWELAYLADPEKDFLRNQVPDTALGTLLGLSDGPPTKSVSARHEVSPLNPQQEQAVDQALTEPLSVVTGPPGTGKSQVVVNILANCVTSGQTVLFASNNNKPLEEVQTRLAAIMGQAGDWTLRMGNKQHRAKARDDMLAQLADDIPVPDESRAADIAAQLTGLGHERDRLMNERQAIEGLHDVIERAQDRERRAASLLPTDWPADIADDPATLPATDPVQFRDVKQELAFLKGEADGGLLFRLRKLLFGRRLVTALDGKLRGLYDRMPARFKDDLFDEHGVSALDDLQRAVTYLDALMAWRKAHLGRDGAMQRLAHCRTGDDVQSELDRIAAKRTEAGQDFLRATWTETLGPNRDKTRDALKRYFDHLERLSQGGGKDRGFFQEMENSAATAMEGLPVWMVTNLSAGGSLPRKPALFDVVVIDEASQCDFASIIPVLLRARRAVVVGDPKQLQHIPGITSRQENALAEDLNAGDLVAAFSPVQRSAYDLAASAAIRRGGQEVLLSQHYRCHPQIIGFSNAAFYQGRLISRHTGGTAHDLPAMGIHWHDVKGELAPVKRSAVNTAEVQAVIDMIENWPHENMAEWSLGIVTPFKRHAERIRTTINAQPWPEAVKTSITVGTAHTFQGSECDVMIFSPVVASGMADHLVRFAAHQDNLLNVAVTRARDALFVVGDRAQCRRAGGALGKLVDYIEYGGSLASPRPTRRSAAEDAFAGILAELGISFEEEYEVVRQDGTAPYRLDFMVVSPSGQRYDLEVDGDEHLNDDRIQSDAVRDKVVEAKGFKVWRFPARDVLNRPEEIKERLRRLP